jgi:hypothetical protein
LKIARRIGWPERAKINIKENKNQASVSKEKAVNQILKEVSLIK